MALETSPESPAAVRTISRMLADWIGRLGAVWIDGQVAEYRPRPGARNHYLVLRDTDVDMSLTVVADASIIGRLDPPLAEGQRILVHAKPDFWTGTRVPVHAGQGDPPRRPRRPAGRAGPAEGTARRRGPVRPGAQEAAAVHPARASDSSAVGRAPRWTTCWPTPANAGRPSSSRSGRSRSRACRRCRPSRRRSPSSTPCPRSTSSSSRAAAAASRTSCRSATRRSCARSPPAGRRSSAPSATSRTPRSSTTSPTCARPRRPTPPSGSSRRSREQVALVDGLRRRGSVVMRHLLDREQQVAPPPATARRGPSCSVASTPPRTTSSTSLPASAPSRRPPRWSAGYAIVTTADGAIVRDAAPGRRRCRPSTSGRRRRAHCRRPARTIQANRSASWPRPPRATHLRAGTRRARHGRCDAGGGRADPRGVAGAVGARRGAGRDLPDVARRRARARHRGRRPGRRQPGGATGARDARQDLSSSQAAEPDTTVDDAAVRAHQAAPLVASRAAPTPGPRPSRRPSAAVAGLLVEVRRSVVRRRLRDLGVRRRPA